MRYPARIRIESIERRIGRADAVYNSKCRKQSFKLQRDDELCISQRISRLQSKADFPLTYEPRALMRNVVVISGPVMAKSWWPVADVDDPRAQQLMPAPRLFGPNSDASESERVEGSNVRH